MVSSATTLITFMLRTPSNTHSVKLLGSWDNFTKEYIMERDARTGADHWRGCHVFTNIICDGNLNTSQPGRDGGLKMGGTYWYYYRLDGDVDHYNEAEPWTTSCPFLPGQPINILNVPIHLPSVNARHNRESSVASQVSIHQTMNPDDKFLNPRPPPRPKLPRLLTSADASRGREAMTSPVSTSPTHQVPGRSLSHPRDVPPARRFRAPVKLTVDVNPPSASSSKGNALRTAIFNFTTPRSGGKDVESDPNWRLKDREANLDGIRGRNPRSNVVREAGPTTKNLQVPVEIYAVERRLRSPSESRYRSDRQNRSRSPFRSPVKIDIHPEPAMQADSEAASSEQADGHDIPSWTVPNRLEAGSVIDLNEKRLPTLPNSPSSVLDEELERMGVSRSPLDVDVLRSHFSVSTAASSHPSSGPFLQPSASRFSDCSTDTDALSPASMMSNSTFNNDTSSSATSEHATCSSSDSPYTKAVGPRIADAQAVPRADECVDSHPSTPVASGSPLDIRISGLHIIKKPRTANGPPIESENAPHDVHIIGTSFPPPLTNEYKQGTDEQNIQLPPLDVQTMMQEIMDELSYLGSMINITGPDNKSF